MSFDKDYPNRKDKRRPYRKAARFDHSCRPHGGCGYCLGNRLHRYRKQLRTWAEKFREDMVTT